MFPRVLFLRFAAFRMGFKRCSVYLCVLEFFVVVVVVAICVVSECSSTSFVHRYMGLE